MSDNEIRYLLQEHTALALRREGNLKPYVNGRPYLTAAKIGSITQGTIFTCGLANRYSGKYVHGLTLTARCDIAQKKYRILNYVPIVKLSDWLITDGSEILVADEQADLKGRLESALKDAEVSVSLLNSVSLRDIEEEHFKTSATDRKGNDRLKKFSALIDFREGFDGAFKSGQQATLEWFKQNRPKKIAELIRKLSRQDVTGFYFLERLQNEEIPEGYVCLLREINTIPQPIAEQLADGLSRTVWREQFHSTGAACLAFDREDFGMPISQIGSPTIEHIMQCFSNLFGRIGLPDPVESEISEIIVAHTNMMEKT